MENALTKANKSIDAVVASNDGIAYGVIQALDSHGLAGKVYVTGEGAEYQAPQLIAGGKWASQVSRRSTTWDLRQREPHRFPQAGTYVEYCFEGSNQTNGRISQVLRRFWEFAERM